MSFWHDQTQYKSKNIRPNHSFYRIVAYVLKEFFFSPQPIFFVTFKTTNKLRKETQMFHICLCTRILSCIFYNRKEQMMKRLIGVWNRAPGILHSFLNKRVMKVRSKNCCSFERMFFQFIFSWVLWCILHYAIIL